MFVSFGKPTLVMRPLILLAAFCFVSLGSLIAQADTSITDMPCRVELDGRHEKLTAGAFANDANETRAEEKAALLAREELARSLGKIAKHFADAYTAIREDKNRGNYEAMGTYFSVHSELVAESLRGAEVICEKTEYRTDGVYVAYTAMGVPRSFFEQSCRNIVKYLEGGPTEGRGDDADEALREVLGE